MTRREEPYADGWQDTLRGLPYQYDLPIGICSFPMFGDETAAASRIESAIPASPNALLHGSAVYRDK